MQCSEHHKTLDADGRGRCSVPMWGGSGLPAGFCDQEAYGERPAGTTHVRWDGFRYRTDGLYPGYVPYLACPDHGGPKVRTFKDGNKWCCVRPDFMNLQESHAEFGDTPDEARAELETHPSPGGAS